ncbi:unnamed protein product [Litomosoides sigmodontis]|uniref:Nucleoporin NDC1 n=1 Tax=Litomosoides sigmodontis TaxID=42156 RepID=A0A3P6T516_LITSI|nr:unnamed protein product [Litomosoides sigmodontis]
MILERLYDFHPSSPTLLPPTVDNQKQQQLSSSHVQLPEHLHQRPQMLSESISQWFQHVMFLRILKAIICFGLYCIPSYFVAACALQISLLHPIQAVLALFAIFGAVHASLLAFFVLRFDSEDRLSCKSLRAWLIYFGSLNTALSQIVWLSIGSNAPEVTRFFIYFLVVAQAVIAFHEVFRRNHRLVFPVVEMRPYMQFNFVLIPAAKSILDAKISQILKWTAFFVVACGLPLFGLSLFRNLFSVSLYFSTSVLLMVHFFLHHVAVGLIKVFVLQSYEFRMPPPHAVLNPTPEEQRTLMDALEANGVIKVFAFWDLRSLSAACYRRRQIIFSLSQPGGHPRNWNAIRLSCLRHIQRLNLQFENENDRVRSETFASITAPLLQSSDSNRPAILGQIAWQKDGLRQRFPGRNFRKVSKESWDANFANRLSSLLEKFFAHVNHHFVTLFDVYIGILAIESVSALICVSLNEDRFGVVQRDLHQIVSALLQFCNNLERYMRSVKTDKEWQNVTCEPLLTSITTALNRIRLTFPEGSISKLLSAQEASYFEKLTSFD